MTEPIYELKRGTTFKRRFTRQGLEMWLSVFDVVPEMIGKVIK